MEPLTERDSPLAGAASLARELAGPLPPVLLDVRWQLGGPPGRGAYLAGHVPGARFIDLDADLSGAPGPAGRHPLPAGGHFQEAMRRAGVRDGYPVVVYDESQATAAARGWWLLRYFGHTRVRVLDGGYRAWLAAGGQADRGDGVAPEPGDFSARPGNMPLIGADEAAALARRGVLLDARAPERYRGEYEPLDPAAGHIPGAVSAPTLQSLAADGRFLPAAGLRAWFATLGAGPGAGDSRAGDSRASGGAAGGDGRGPGVTAALRVGSYCGSGVTAAHEVLALELAGVPAALYLGSWSNWTADPSRPVATGPEPG